MPSIKELYHEHGYFSLIFEKMTLWEWYTDLPCFKLMVHLIIKCMKQDTRYKGELIKRGQYRTSQNRLATETGLSRQQVRTAMIKLENTGEISATKSKAKQRTIITLCNFEKYQIERINSNKGSNQAPTKLQPSNNDNTNEFNVFNIRPDWFPEDAWKDMVIHRRKHPKKPRETERAYNKLIKEFKIAYDAGHDIDDIVSTMCMKNWMAFEAKYLDGNSVNQPRAHSVSDRLTLMNEQLAREINEQHKTRQESGSKGSGYLGY